MRVSVFKDGLGWDGLCDCGEHMSTESWADTMEFAVGHLCFTHQTPIGFETPC